jgi:hypothetical protein
MKTEEKFTGMNGMNRILRAEDIKNPDNPGYPVNFFDRMKFKKRDRMNRIFRILRLENN